MVGAAPEITPPVERQESTGGFRLTGICARSDVGIQAVDHVDLELPHGVIVGIGGVDGNGQTELAEAVVGIRPLSGGSVSYDPQTLSVGYIPQDRQTDGLALEMSIQDNLLIRGIRKPSHTKCGLLRLHEIARWTKGLVDRFAIKIGEPTDPARSLSGGNQQKVIVARTLESSVDLLVEVNPTRGLDLKATQFVHEQIRAAAAGGASVLLISTDLDELAALSERTVFLNRGKIVEGDLAAALLTAGGSA
jgi:simple sugar transport system ATP-binding protein